MKKLIFFDVDGVLVDSQKEIMLTSWNEFNLWKDEMGLPSEPFCTDVAEVADDFFQARAAFGRLSHKGYHRAAINPLILAGFDPQGFTTQLIQDLSETDESQKAASMRRLHQVRERLLAEGDVASLAETYDAVDYDWVKSHMLSGELYFLTNNAFSIESFAAVAFKPLPEMTLLPEGKRHDKAVHIRRVCEENGVSENQCIFIDDSYSSLVDVQKGASLPLSHILQNDWCEKKITDGFERLSWKAIVARYDEI